MKILLLYFTGTYNTLFLTTLLKNQLMRNNHSVDVEVINKKLKVKKDAYDLIGIGYPIHCFNAPKIIVNTLKKLKLENKNYFIYKNGASIKKSASSNEIIKLMKKNNNKLLNEYQFIMPPSLGVTMPDSFIYYLLDYNILYSKAIASNINKKRKVNYSINEKIRTFNGSKKVKKLKKDVKNYFVDKDKCLRCKSCRSCPTNNIKYDRELRKTVFYDNCELCYRCIAFCPSNALNASLLNKYKIERNYNYFEILKNKDSYVYPNEQDKYYLKYKKYFDYIDKFIS